MLPQHSFGYWLRLKRKAHDLTREELASRVGCSAATIRKLEAEERRPSAQIAERLAGIFNIPPSETESFHRFTRGDWKSAPRESVEDAPWRAGNITPRSNLPFPATSLIGREKEIAEVRDYLQKTGVRLITLLGPPGIGKTRLSIEIARAERSQFPEGVFFVALAPLDDPSLVVLAILQALGYVESKDLPAAQEIKLGIGEKHILLVLDNCEHLIDVVAPVVNDLLLACPNLTILVTSRESLRIHGEWIYNVPTLDSPNENSVIDTDSASLYPALTLFTERARAVRSDFHLNSANIHAVSSICRQLDGLPLAIELIAARMRLMAPQDLLERMTDQFVLSADGMRAVVARQKTLNNAIGWSFNFLPVAEQKLFASLSVFSGGFRLEAVEAIYSKSFHGKSVSDVIISFVDKSLLQRTLDLGGEIRFNMLVTIRQFGLNSLRQMGHEVEARNEHLAYYLDLAERGKKEIRASAQASWNNRLESELDNFRAALDWAVSTRKTEFALRLLCALGWPWEVRGHYREMSDWLDKIRALPDVSDYPAISARLLNHVGRHSWAQNRFQDACSLLEESRLFAIRLGSEGEPILAEALNWLGLVEMYVEKDIDSARSMFTQSLDLYQKWGDTWGVALGTFHLGILEGDIGHEDAALSLLEKSYSLFSQFGDIFFIARVSIYLGYLHIRLGKPDNSRQYFEQQLKLDQEIQFWDGIADGWSNLGNLYHSQGLEDKAFAYYEDSVLICLEHDLDKPGSFYMSGLVALHLQNYELAFQRFIHNLSLALRSGTKTSFTVLLFGLASVAAGRGQAERAATLFGVAEASLHITGSELSSFEQAAFERHKQIVVDRLGNEAFKSLQAEGRVMTIEQAVAFALEDRGFQEPLRH